MCYTNANAIAVTCDLFHYIYGVAYILVLCVYASFSLAFKKQQQTNKKRLRSSLISTERLNTRKFPAVHIFRIVLTICTDLQCMDHCDGSFESKCCCCVFLFGFICFCPIARKDETYNFFPGFFSTAF